MESNNIIKYLIKKENFIEKILIKFIMKNLRLKLNYD